MEYRDNAASGTGLMDRVRNSATSQLDAQKTRATDGIGSVAQAVRQSTQQLRDQKHETIAQYVDQAADQLERFANRLKDRNVGDLLNEAQDLARRRPAIFIGSAFALGLLGARFIKSSNRGNGRTYGISGGQHTSAGAAYGDGGELRGGGYGGWTPGSGVTIDTGRS
jgi:hypothetical protein